jgi:cell division protein FtsZ
MLCNINLIVRVYMSIKLQLPSSVILKPCITVFGVGGAGCNAVNNMIHSNLEGVRFVVANTDAQSLNLSDAEHKLPLGVSITKGLGAGASPDVGKAAAEEVIDDISSLLSDSNMIFITAGMGGGTGTGAAPVIAKLAREKGILTVAVVTKPFHFEGVHRMRLADSGLNELQRFVDTLIVIPNQNLFKIANAKTTFADAFKMADNVLHAGVRGITDLMVMPGLINLDFADIRTVMSEMGKAMMGTGEGQGENRAIVAAEAAISNPLLDNCSMKGARGVLINISGGYDMTLFEVDEAANRIREEVDPEANIIFGSAFNSELDGIIRVSVVATGIDAAEHMSTQQKLNTMHALSPKSTIEKMQQLYKADSPVMSAAPKLQTQPALFSSLSNIVEKESNITADASTLNVSSDILVSNSNNLSNSKTKYSGVFFSPEAIDPNKELYIKNHDLKSNTNKLEESKTIGLFERMANSIRSINDHETTEVKEQITQDDKNSTEEDLVTEDMLNIPAYQRRSK